MNTMTKDNEGFDPKALEHLRTIEKLPGHCEPVELTEEEKEKRHDLEMKWLTMLRETLTAAVQDDAEKTEKYKRWFHLLDTGDAPTRDLVEIVQGWLEKETGLKF